MSRASKELKKLMREARAAGWRIEQTSRGHSIWFPPDRSQGPVVTGSGSGDPRSMQNIIAQLRQRGWEGR